MDKTASECLKDYRPASMTQEQVAEALGVSRKTINSWENGQAESMPLGKAIKLADLYHAVTIDEMVGRK